MVSAGCRHARSSDGLATIAGLYEYLLVRGDTPVARNPVPRGLALRRNGRAGSAWCAVDPHAADAAPGAAIRTRSTRSWRRCAPTATGRWSRRCCWAGYVAARCWACGSATSTPGEQRVFIADGKGGHQRIVPISARFFTDARRLPGHGTAARRRHRPGVRGVEGPPARPAAVRGRVGRDRRRRPRTRRDRPG